MNILAAEVLEDAVVAGPFRLPRSRALPARVEMGVRPEDVKLVDEGGVPGAIAAVEPLGAETHLVVEVEGASLRVRAPGFDLRSRGDRVSVALDPAKIHLFDPEQDGARLAS
jgi:ABC-type sugar transport system ATPase subunit